MQKGFSLIEVMLACALGIFLIQGVAGVYLSSKRIFEMQNAIVHLQENARFATHFLTHNIRMAGDASCEKAPIEFDSSGVIQGYQSHPPAELKNKILSGTDSLVIKKCNFKKGLEQFEKYAFFISESSRRNRMGKKVYSLYEAPISGSKTELVPNVMDMRISYGITNGQTRDIQAYLPAERVSNWEMVKSVEIALLLSSESPVLSEPESVQFMGIDLPESRYLRRQWNLYINLRERAK